MLCCTSIINSVLNECLGAPASVCIMLVRPSSWQSGERCWECWCRAAFTLIQSSALFIPSSSTPSLLHSPILFPLSTSARGAIPFYLCFTLFILPQGWLQWTLSHWEDTCLGTKVQRRRQCIYLHFCGISLILVCACVCNTAWLYTISVFHYTHTAQSFLWQAWSCDGVKGWLTASSITQQYWWVLSRLRASLQVLAWS